MTLKHSWRAAALLALAVLAVVALQVLPAEAGAGAGMVLASVPVSAWFENAYIRGATHKLQSRGFLLKGTTREPDRVQAKTVIWRVAGRGEAHEMPAIPEEAEVMNSDRATVEATLRDYQAADWWRHTDANKMSENEQDVIQTTAAMALGRKFDRIHFDEFDAQAGAIETIGDGSTPIDIMSMQEAEGEIMGHGVLGPLELFCPLPARAFNQLKLWKQFSNADYVGPDYPLAKMTQRKKWGFVTYFQCPNEMFTYNTGVGPNAWKTATDFKSYMWLKYAAGFATNYELQSKITWENRFTSYFCNNWMPGACKVILPDGFKRLHFLFNKTPAIPADTRLVEEEG